MVAYLTAGLEKVFSIDTAVGFVSHAQPRPCMMNRPIFNGHLDATLAALFVAGVVATSICDVIDSREAKSSPPVA